MGAVREELPLSLHDAASKAIDGYVDATPQSPTSVLEAGVEPPASVGCWSDARHASWTRECAERACDGAWAARSD